MPGWSAPPVKLAQWVMAGLGSRWGMPTGGPSLHTLDCG